MEHYIAGRAIVGNDTDGRIFKCDVIEHTGEFWLVPEWIHCPDEGWTAPKRIIPMASVGYQEAAFADCRWSVKLPVPIALLEGHAPPALAAAFRAVENPAIRFEGPAGKH